MLKTANSQQTCFKMYLNTNQKKKKHTIILNLYNGKLTANNKLVNCDSLIFLMRTEKRKKDQTDIVANELTTA